MHIRRAFTKYRALTRAERRVLWRSFLALPAVAVWLRVRGLGSLRATLGRRSRRLHRARHSGIRSPQMIGHLVNLAARRGLWRANCLERSLVTYWIATNRGIPVDLRIGVRKDEDDAETRRFHAWVESDGHVINDSPAVASEYHMFTGNLVPGSSSFDA